jgi:hypothetical protein
VLTSLPVLLKGIESSNESIVTGTGIECKAGISSIAFRKLRSSLSGEYREAVTKTQPRVAALWRLPWVGGSNDSNPNGVVSVSQIKQRGG